MSIPIALQLYSVRKDCAEDFPGTLKAVAEMGYDGVEFAGYYERGASELKNLTGDLGMKVAGTHIGLDTLLGDKFEETVAFNIELGNRYLIVPWLSEEYRGDVEAWQRTADVFNKVSEKLPAGMYIGYHNHNIEFTEIDGRTPWDIFFGGTVDEVVMQVDTGNAIDGGGVPEKMLEKYPGRARTVHLKEFSSTNDKAVIGEGDVNWEAVFHLCETVQPTEWYIVEQESYAHSPLECASLCLEALRKMGKHH